jgi:hypothetical protein
MLDFRSLPYGDDIKGFGSLGHRRLMPRRTTPFLPDQYYHFYNRGNNRQAVFFERDNYLYFLRGLKKYVCSIFSIFWG